MSTRFAMPAGSWAYRWRGATELDAMNSQLPRLITTLDGRRTALLGELQTWNDAALHAKPQADRWSTLEILEHFVIAERVILQNLPPTANLVARARGLKHRILYRVVWLILRFAIPVKVPTRKMNPTGSRTLDEITAMWIENLRWAGGYAEALENRADDPTVLLHPVAGPLTRSQAS